MRKLILSLAAAAALPSCTTMRANAPSAQMWLTTADAAHKLAKQPVIPSAGPVTGDEAVSIDPSRRFQQIHGFGAAMTDASAELFSRLPDDKRRAIMVELFGRENGGLGLSFTRLTVGASDFSRSHYSYDDPPGNVADPALRYFSIEPAREYVLPRVREALEINPDLKVMISPWSAPAWMKTTRSMIKGQLEPRYHAPFAEYLARTIEAFTREGVPVSMLTIQNEPDFEPPDYPGMRVSPSQRAEIIGRHLGSLLKRRNIRTQILDWDHNWNQPQQPLTVLADPAARQYVSGIAWHCYEGDVPAQSIVHEAYRDKQVWHTECSGGAWNEKFKTWESSLAWMTDKLIIGAANHWARGSLLWNLALDPAGGPHAGGCPACRGVLTIDPASGAITREVEYYVLGHASRFIFPGAYRVGVAKRGGEVEAAAFLNPDGSKVAILYRRSRAGPIAIGLGGRRYLVSLPAGSVVTLRWSAEASVEAPCWRHYLLAEALKSCPAPALSSCIAVAETRPVASRCARLRAMTRRCSRRRRT